MLALRWTYQNMITVVVGRFIRWFAFVFLVISFFPSALLGRSRFALVVHGVALSAFYFLMDGGFTLVRNPQIGGFRNSARLRRAHIFDQFLWAQPRNPHPSVAVQASRTMVEPNTLNLRSRWEWPSQQHVVSKGRLVYAIALVLLLPRILIDEATEHCFVRQNRWMLLLRLFCDCLWPVTGEYALPTPLR